MITIDDKELEKAQKLLGGIENGVKRAITSAINHSLGKAKTKLKKKITQEYYIKSSDVEKTLSIKKANYSTLAGTISSRTKRTSLTKLKIKKSGTSILSGVRKSNGIKLLRGKDELFGKPFTAKMKNGHTGVFQRKTKQRIGVGMGSSSEQENPIQELYTLSIPQMAGEKGVQKYIEEEAEKMVNERFEHEVERILKGYIK
jgi:hypothetical protein|nr:MAG TPA_asm: minor tail protein Z [Caudoviricetes sp.]